MKIEQVSLDSVSLDPANVRRHNQRNLDAIKASLRRFGQQKPIVVDATGIIRAGNGTFEAAKALGWKKINAVRTKLAGPDAVAFAIADNRTSDLSHFDLESLLGELRSLEETGIPGEEIGFTDDDISQIVAQLEEEKGPKVVVEDEAPEPPEIPITQHGDLWVMGGHRLLCSDSTKEDDVERLMAGEKAALLATDPPYCVGYTGADRPQSSGKDWTRDYHEVEINNLEDFLRGVLKSTIPHTNGTCAIYVWHGHRQYPVIDKLFQEFGILPHQQIVWLKPASTFTYAFYRWAHEPCVMGCKKKHKPHHYLKNTVSSVWEADWEGKGRIVGNKHPTQKPVRLFAIPIEQHTVASDIVLEPFSGSGSQLSAAEQLGRRCFAMEISPVFVDVEVERWENLTGKKAERIPFGQTAQATPGI